MAKYVVDDGRLTGFIGMPGEPFVWLYLQESHEDPYSLEMKRKSGEMSTLVAAPEGAFPEEAAVSSVAMSEELVQLFDKYGVPFTADVSELFVYSIPPTWTVVERQREFRFIHVDGLRQLQVSFLRLIDAWLDLYAPVTSAVKADEAEVYVLRPMVIDFLLRASANALANGGWGEERAELVRHLFTPKWLLFNVSAAVLQKRETLMEAAGYRKFVGKVS